MNYNLPLLTYEYDALEPYFDSQTMKIHYENHHRTYVNNVHLILEGTKFLQIDPKVLITKLEKIDIKKRLFLQNNLGGHINHSLFWDNLKTKTILKGDLKKEIEKYFGSFKEFKRKFTEVGLGRFGSGWVWLTKIEDGSLVIQSTANQNNPFMKKEYSGISSGKPIICLDLWEHAYYLKFQNRRADYINAFWKVVNWDIASARFK